VLDLVEHVAFDNDKAGGVIPNVRVLRSVRRTRSEQPTSEHSQKNSYTCTSSPWPRGKAVGLAANFDRGLGDADVVVERSPRP
jgi:hypothetical protein